MPPLKPLVPYSRHTPEEWQLLLTDGIQNHDQQQVTDAVTALNQYSQESVDATKLSSIPGELGSIGKGLGEGLAGIPESLSKLAGDISGGHFARAAGDVIQGVKGTAENMAGVFEPAFHNMAVAIRDRTNFDPNDEYTPESITRKRIEGAASTLPGLAAADVAGRLAGPTIKSAAGTVAKGATGLIGGTLGRVVRGLGKLGEAGEEGGEAGSAAPSTGPTGPTPVIDPNVVDLTRGAGRTPAPTPVEDINLPRGGPSVPGYMPSSAMPPAPPAAPVSMEGQMAQVARNVRQMPELEQSPASATPTQPLTDALRLLSDEDLAKQPMGAQPPVEQSAMAQPGIPPELPSDIMLREMLRNAKTPNWIGTGPESITPADLAKTQIMGEMPAIGRAGRVAAGPGEPLAFDDEGVQIPNKPAITPSEPPTPTTPTGKPGEVVGNISKKGKGGKSATFAKGTRPEFKSNVLQVLGEIAKAIQNKQALY